jgi:hypothetical protein
MRHINIANTDIFYDVVSSMSKDSQFTYVSRDCLTKEANKSWCPSYEPST